MLFSFMGPQHGRIIQVYHDGQDLVVRKSPLVALKEPSLRPFDVFVRSAASKPVGDTRSLPVHTKVSTQQG